jgi:hypothetical protein
MIAKLGFDGFHVLVERSIIPEEGQRYDQILVISQVTVVYESHLTMNGETPGNQENRYRKLYDNQRSAQARVPGVIAFTSHPESIDGRDATLSPMS